MVQHAQKQGAGAILPQQPHGASGAGQPEDLNLLLKTITTSDKFQSNNLEDSLDKLDEILKQVRVKKSNMQACPAEHPANDIPPHRLSNLRREESVDAIIKSLDMEDLLESTM
mmetsp:Transcript_30914/g.87510  ORF Transcript_30914/g.87510 Transcript_30914/m.87510 type:complete len:113 (+) Transcript_30914:2933-3271(+)